MEQKELKPKLRFPGFSEDWSGTRLTKPYIEIIDGDRGVEYPKSSEFSDTGYCLFLNAQNVTQNGFVFDSVKFISKQKDQIMGKGKLNRNDIVLTTRGTVGNFAYFDNSINYEDIRINSGMVLIRVEKDLLYPQFTYKYLKSEKVTKQIRRLSFGSAQPQLTVKGISNISISYPSLSEQQKIASFLSSIDNWINNLKSQKEALEKYKKGVMQKIFNREIRFKDENGNDYPEWEEKKLGDTGKIITGTTPSTDVHSYYLNGIYPWVTPTDIASKNTNKTGRRLTDEGIRVGRFIPKDSLLVTCIASIGKNTILRVNGSCNQQINAIVPNRFISVDFLYYLTEQNINLLLSLAGGGNLAMINKNDFSNIKIPIPSHGEQQRIASCLTSIDNQIEHKQKEVVSAEAWKKGLMQGLFI